MHGFEPFYFVERKSIRNHASVAPICVDKLLKQLHRLTMTVKKKINAMPPDKFAFVFDGWSPHGSNYVCVLANVPAEINTGFQRAFQISHRSKKNLNSLQRNTKILFRSSYGNITSHGKT